MPTLVYNGDAATYGTVDSATLIVESDYFSAVNLNIVVRTYVPLFQSMYLVSHLFSFIGLYI